MQGASRNVTAGWVRSQTPQTDVLPSTFICEFFSPLNHFLGAVCVTLWVVLLLLLCPLNAKCKSRAGFPEHCHSCLYRTSHTAQHTQSPSQQAFLGALCPVTWQEGHGAAVRIKGLFLLREKLMHLSILLPKCLTVLYKAWWVFDHPNLLRASLLLVQIVPTPLRRSESYEREENQVLCNGSVGGTSPLSLMPVRCQEKESQQLQDAANKRGMFF